MYSPISFSFHVFLILKGTKKNFHFSLVYDLDLRNSLANKNFDLTINIKLYFGTSRVVPRSFENPRKEIRRVPRGEKITSRIHWPCCEKNQLRDINPRKLFRGFDPEEFSSRFIFYTSRIDLPRGRKLNLEVQKSSRFISRSQHRGIFLEVNYLILRYKKLPRGSKYLRIRKMPGRIWCLWCFLFSFYSFYYW